MRRKVLLVDDDDAIREITQLSLERVGDWAVEAAASGEEALRTAADRGPFDVVLLDVMMPGLDGPTTLRRLREGPLKAGTPVVFLTAKLQPADRRRLLDLGAAGVIAKPFDPMALAADLDAILVGDADA